MARFLIGPIEVTVMEEGKSSSSPWKMRLGNFEFTFFEGLKVATILPDDKVLPFTCPKQGVDRKNNPTDIKTPPTVAVSDAAMLTVTVPDPTTPDDPWSGIITPNGPLGTAQVTFTDTVDAPDQTKPLMAIVDLTVVGGQLVALGQPTLGPLRDLPPTP